MFIVSRTYFVCFVSYAQLIDQRLMKEKCGQTLHHLEETFGGGSLGFLDPLVQGMGRTTYLRGNRRSEPQLPNATLRVNVRFRAQRHMADFAPPLTDRTQNWMFSGSGGDGKAKAITFTLIETAKSC